MINLSLLYKDKEALKKQLTISEFHALDRCLVRIYTAVCTKEQSVGIANEIKELLCNAQIIGASGSGIIFEGKQYEDATLVSFEKFERSEIMVHTHSFFGKTAKELALEIADSIKGKAVPLMHMLCGNHYYDIGDFVEEFNKQNSITKLVGGVVGDILSENITGYVFTEDGVIENGIVTAAFCGDGLYTFNQANIAHSPISTCYRLNRCKGSLLLEIENKPGDEWCREQFGMKDLKEYPEWQLIAENDALVRFPIILEGHSGASRFLRYDAASREISLYFSKISDNTLFRIGYTSPIACVQECLAICKNIMKTPVEGIFCYTCLFRKLYMENCAEWELRPFLKDHICGVFMMGELAYINGKNEFLNGASSFVGVAENRKYIKPDFNVFEDLYKIKDDNQKLVSYVLQKQNAAMSNENVDLIKKLLQQQELTDKQLYIDANTGIQNSIKFSEDNRILHFDKMCMVQVENYRLLITKLGHDGYYGLIGKVAKEAYCYVQETYEDAIYYYILDNSILFLTTNASVSEAKFMEIVNDLYHRYQFVKQESQNELLVNRFVVILQQDLLIRGLATLRNCGDWQTHFLISNDSTVDNPEFENEMEMIHILNYVIEQKKVIPYFQGIYDNKEKKINTYEALMRIQDAAGKIYTPYFFMDIAKKYHMYVSLSKLMIEQVFKLFSGRKEVVSINLSAYDINLDEMQDFIFYQLDHIEAADNFVFEILEDEDFKDMNRLKTFIEKARKYGVEIAIDDFGSGYSSFMEIVNLEPDYIKIDSSIIKNVDSNVINQKVLENINFLGKQLNVKVVAEGVETEKIQENIEAIDIQYSQGFYFAKPVPHYELTGKNF